MKRRPKVIVADYGGLWNVLIVNHRGEVSSGALYRTRRTAMNFAKECAKEIGCKVSVV